MNYIMFYLFYYLFTVILTFIVPLIQSEEGMTKEVNSTINSFTERNEWIISFMKWMDEWSNWMSEQLSHSMSEWIDCRINQQLILIWMMKRLTPAPFIHIKIIVAFAQRGEINLRNEHMEWSELMNESCRGHLLR